MSTEEKTEEATHHKLQEAREKGQVSKSMDVTGTAGMLVCLVTILFVAKHIGGQLMAMMEKVLLIAPDVHIESNTWLMGELFQTYIYAVMPVMVMAILVGVFVSMIQTGGVFSFFPLKPDIKKLNPIKGLKKLISLKSLFELIKSVIRLVAISILAYVLFYDEVVFLPDVVGYSLPDILNTVYRLLVKTVAFFILTMLPFTFFDFFFQRWSFKKEMRMSKKEVKDEHKNQEGDPEVGSKRKQMQKEMREKVKSLSNVPSADVVIINPTFVAIALKYDTERMVAPKVVSKGKGPLARKIRESANKNRVLMRTNIPLARTIYKKVRINSEIPPELYEEVAEIYRWYFEQKKK